MAPLATPPTRRELLVVQPLRKRHCAECRRGPLLVVGGGVPRCLDCADLGHLVFLPRTEAGVGAEAESGVEVGAEIE